MTGIDEHLAKVTSREPAQDLTSLCEDVLELFPKIIPGEYRACRINGNSYLEAYVNDNAKELVATMKTANKAEWERSYFTFMFLAKAKDLLPLFAKGFVDLQKQVEQSWKENRDNSAMFDTLDKLKDQEIADLKAEIERLKAGIPIVAGATAGTVSKHHKEKQSLLIEALLFYAKPANWTKSDQHMYHRTVAIDDVTTTPSEGFYSAGKRARKALKSFGVSCT